MARLSQALHEGLPIPEECLVLKGSGSVRGLVTLILEGKEEPRLLDATTTMTAMGLWMYGATWWWLHESLGLDDDPKAAYRQLIDTLEGVPDGRPDKR